MPIVTGTAASLLKWVIKNPLFSITLLSLISVSVYAGVEKVGHMSTKIKLESAKTELISCTSALKIQSDRILALGKERDKLKGDLDLAMKDAEEIMVEAGVRVEALLNEVKANDCSGNLKRFFKQLEGTAW